MGQNNLPTHHGLRSWFVGPREGEGDSHRHFKLSSVRKFPLPLPKGEEAPLLSPRPIIIFHQFAFCPPPPPQLVRRHRPTEKFAPIPPLLLLLPSCGWRRRRCLPLQTFSSSSSSSFLPSPPPPPKSMKGFSHGFMKKQRGRKTWRKGESSLPPSSFPPLMNGFNDFFCLKSDGFFPFLLFHGKKWCLAVKTIFSSLLPPSYHFLSVSLLFTQ